MFIPHSHLQLLNVSLSVLHSEDEIYLFPTKKLRTLKKILRIYLLAEFLKNSEYGIGQNDDICSSSNLWCLMHRASSSLDSIPCVASVGINTSASLMFPAAPIAPGHRLSPATAPGTPGARNLRPATPETIDYCHY